MFLLIVILVMCSGCSTSPYLHKQQGAQVPSGSTSPSASQGASPGPALYWSEDGKQLLLVTMGSSSCPTEPVGVTVPSPNAVDIELGQGGGWFCTADLGPTTFTLEVPAGISNERPLEFWVDGGFVYELPAFE